MSDSDSDICDLFSDFSKKAAKSEDRFWKKFTVKDTTQEEPDTIENLTPLSQHVSTSEPKEGITAMYDEPNCSDTSSIKRKETSILTTINTKIENVSQKMKEILEAPKRGRGSRGRRGCRRQTSTRRRGRRSDRLKNISAPIILSDDEDIKEVNLIPVDVNPVVTINVLWKSVETHIFKIRKFDKLTPIKDYYVKNKRADPQLLFFTLDNKEFQLENHSFVSLRLTDDKVIEGSTLPKTYLNKGRDVCFDTQFDYTFKMQINSHRSKPFSVKCRSTDNMEIIFWQAILKTGENIRDIKLYFDGRSLKPNDEIAKLGLENGDCFDLILLHS